MRRCRVRGRLGSREAGGAAIEYVLVSLFATVFSVAAIAFVSKVIKTKMTEIGEKLGIEMEFDF
jgi:Flp pilus assembly pilin Flp